MVWAEAGAAEWVVVRAAVVAAVWALVEAEEEAVVKAVAVDKPEAKKNG